MTGSQKDKDKKIDEMCHNVDQNFFLFERFLNNPGFMSFRNIYLGKITLKFFLFYVVLL